MGRLMKSAVAFVVFWLGAVCVFIVRIVSFDGRYDGSFDNIVALTGDRGRIAEVFRLAEVHKSKNAFISGVYERTTLSDIKVLLPKKPISDVRVVLGKQARNTEENAREISEWAKQNDISEVLLITSDYHLPRALVELKIADDSLKARPYAVKSDFNFKFVWRCIKEFHKIAYVCARNFVERIRAFVCR
jgi:uncharacterized SAM-binding protein YcdF (DUF218 family)